MADMKDIPEVLNRLTEAMKDNPEYAWSWHCNMATAAHNEGLNISSSHKSAARFMWNTFGIDMSTSNKYKITQIKE